MNLLVKYTGLAKRLVGCDQEPVAVPEGSTLRELLRTLSDRHGPDFRNYLFAGGENVSPEILVLLNGQNVLSLQGLETPLGSPAGSEVEVVFLGPIPVGG
ncbi:MAG: MoaD/ThiS family protein [Acidobacteria bacterium]|nr:MoaD/ThiS family protein [Acidobacteriota bacterium]